MEDFDLFLVPISLVVSVAAVLAAYFYFRYRSRAENQATVRAAFDRGQQLTPEVLEALASDFAPSQDMDFRRGVMACAVGAGIAAFGWLSNDDIGMPLALSGVGAVPFIIGLAYLGLWKFAPRR